MLRSCPVVARRSVRSGGALLIAASLGFCQLRYCASSPASSSSASRPSQPQHQPSLLFPIALRDGSIFKPESIAEIADLVARDPDAIDLTAEGGDDGGGERNVLHNAATSDAHCEWCSSLIRHHAARAAAPGAAAAAGGMTRQEEGDKTDSTKAKDSSSPLDAAASAPDRYDYTPLHIAAAYGSPKMAAALLKPKQSDGGAEDGGGGGGGAGVDPTAVGGPDENTPIFLCAQFDRAEVIPVLIANGADVSGPPHLAGRQKRQMTPLHSAALYGSIASLEALLRCGAKVDARADDGCTPLLYTAQRQVVPAAKILLGKGADPNARAGDGATAMHRFTVFGAKELLSVVIAAGGDVNQLDESGNAPLHYAATDGLLDCCRVLIEEGKANVDLRQAKAASSKNSPLTPLHLAISKDRLAVVEYLLSKGADPMAPFEIGEVQTTPFHLAAAKGHLDICRALVAGGADWLATDHYGQAARNQAHLKGHDHIVNYIDTL